MNVKTFDKVDEDLVWLAFGRVISLFDLVSIVQAALKGVHFCELMLVPGQGELMLIRTDYQVQPVSGVSCLRCSGTCRSLFWEGKELPSRFEHFLSQVRQTFPGESFQRLAVVADRCGLSISQIW